MDSSFVRRSPLALVFVALTACHDVPQAPNNPPPGPQWVHITMDDGVTDYPSWGGLDLLKTDTEYDFVVAETEYGTLHYGGCVQDCQDPSRWLVGTIDSGVYRGLGENASTARTATELVVAYEDQQTSVSYVKIGTCDGACYKKASWTFGDVRTGFLGTVGGSHSRVLVADAGAGLHLLYRGPHNLGLYYAECAAACTDSASWHSTFLDTANFQASDVALGVAGNGALRVLAGTSDTTRGLIYFTCDTGCTVGGNWASVVLSSRSVGHTPSIRIGPTGSLYVTYGRAPVFATCASSCLNYSSWTFTPLPDSGGSDLSLAFDASGNPWVAISHGLSSNYNGHTTVLHCAAACTDASSWQTLTVDSLGDALDISMVMDPMDRPRLMVSGTGVHYAQRPDTTVAAAHRR